MVNRVEERFGIKPERLIGDIGLWLCKKCSADGRRKGQLSRTCQCGTKLNGPMKPSHAATSVGMNKLMSIAARRVGHCGVSGVA
jgi:hypothetical protein